MSPNEQGQVSWTAADILWDVQVEYPQANGETYSPVNYDGRFHGPVRLREALANSYNIPAVLLLQDIGVPHYLEFARLMGIESWQKIPASMAYRLTLGGAEVTPLELTGAYSSLPTVDCTCRRSPSCGSRKAMERCSMNCRRSRNACSG